MKTLRNALLCLSVLALASCSKKDKAVISTPLLQVGKSVSNSAPLSGAIKGTMLANQTYAVNSDVTINAGDTLLIQKGVTVKMLNGANFIVKGMLLTLGTKDAPITITDPSKTKATGPSSAATDPAYVGGWGGIYCDKTCPLLVIKWTHLDFGGAGLAAPPFTGPSTGDQYVVYWQNPNGAFIMEDSWIYGGPDDAVRFYGGHVNIMRNTLEKCGGTGGDGFNAKGGTQGNMAYNLIIGSATNGTKSANDPGTQSVQTQIAMYNNTYVNDGFRNTGTYGARSGSIEVENNSRAYAYNNLIVDCNFGVRIAGGNNTTAKVYLADTLDHGTSGPITKTAYGYNFYYVDNVAQADQIVPTNIAQAVVTHPQSTDIPNMATFLGAGYTFGAAYDGSSLVGKNNPMFVNFPLPEASGAWVTQASVDGFDFHLQAGSPAVGKGTTNAFSPITTGIPVDPNFGSSGITPPGKDIGCYQRDGSGNQH